MKIDKIRQMTDEELKEYLKNLTSKRKDMCIKCGETEVRYAVYIQNRDRLQQRKLCNICDKCYEELLDYLETEDVIWD